MARTVPPVSCALLLLAPAPIAQNDECTGAIAVSEGTILGSNAGATTSATTGSCGLMGADVWYTYKPTCDGTAVVDTCLSSIDTVLAVFEGDCAALTEIRCNDDEDLCGPGSVQSAVDFVVQAGQTYRIAVGGFLGDQGDFALTLTCTPSSETGLGGFPFFTRRGPGADFVRVGTTTRVNQVVGLQVQTEPFTLTLPALPANANAVDAFVTWAYLLDGAAPATDSIVLNGNAVQGTVCGTGTPDLCWGEERGVAYKATVPLGNLVLGGGNTVAGATDKALGTDQLALGEGLTTLVVYEVDGDPERNVDLYCGYASTETRDATFEIADLSFELSTYYESGGLRLYLNALDGQFAGDDFLIGDNVVSEVVTGAFAEGNAWAGLLGPNPGDNLYDAVDHVLNPGDLPATGLVASTKSVLPEGGARDCIAHTFAGLSFPLGDEVCQDAKTCLEAQPAKKGTFMGDKDGVAVRDSEFAKWIQDLLVPGGENDARDAAFLFQPCYGGGMLDDLQTALGDKVKWVGGAGSKHDQKTRTHVSQKEADDHPWDQKWVSADPNGFWTEVLKVELAKDQTVLKAIKSTPPKVEDLAKKRETVQYVSRNGGETIELGDETAHSYHAVLWAGNPNFIANFNDIRDIRAVLIDKWGPPSPLASITTLFGDGMKNSKGDDLPAGWNAVPATRANLQTILTGLQAQIDEDVQLLFYASFHGGRYTQAKVAPAAVPGGAASDLSEIELVAGEYVGMLGEEANQPSLIVDYSGNVANGAVSVLFNGNVLGFLEPSQTSVEFPVSEGFLRPINQVLVDSVNPSPLTIEQVTFLTGGIGGSPSTSLDVDTLLLSVGSGGTLTWELDAGSELAGELYLVLGSASGTAPGIPLGPLTLPLVVDPYFMASLTGPNAPPFANTFGVLDAGGEATAQLVLPPGVLPISAVGLVLHHAFVAIEPGTGIVDFASYAVPVELEP